MRTYRNESFDEERALYGEHDILVSECRIDGPKDGESAFKECSDVRVERTYLNLRYPFWHDSRLEISESDMTENCRAALWYSDGIRIDRTRMHGIKALRECRDISITRSDIISPEFGWSCDSVEMNDTKAEGEYFMMRSSNLLFTNVDFKGKYSFQYIHNATFRSCRFDTKDAFWHAENVLVEDSEVKGEYLAWYSDCLTLRRCTIIGTQPLCYCRHLVLEDCTMIDTDLSFEKSDVNAVINSHILSVKNPRRGLITAPSIKEIIRDDETSEARIVIS